MGEFCVFTVNDMSEITGNCFRSDCSLLRLLTNLFKLCEANKPIDPINIPIYGHAYKEK